MGKHFDKLMPLAVLSKQYAAVGRCRREGLRIDDSESLLGPRGRSPNDPVVGAGRPFMVRARYAAAVIGSRLKLSTKFASGYKTIVQFSCQACFHTCRDAMYCCGQFHLRASNSRDAACDAWCSEIVT
jgi:hypothetical protein